MGQAWSLRFRLLVGQVVILAVVCIGIGAATELALYRYLVAQPVSKLRAPRHRSGGLLGDPPPARAELGRPPVNRPPATINVDGLGRYRVVAAIARRSGDVVITGLSMSDVDGPWCRVLLS